MTFDEFMRDSACRNEWVHEPGLSIYIRKTPAPCRDRWGDIQIANVTAAMPGAGAFTAFMDRIELGYSVYVENVINMRLDTWLARRGYQRRGQLYPSCFLKVKS